MNNAWALWIVVVWCHVITVTCEGPLCYACDKVANAQDCPNVVRCSENEKCYAQRLIGRNLQEFYKLGCVDRDICKQREFSLFGGPFSSVIGKRADRGLQQRQAQDEMLLCLQCCDGDNCNSSSCGSRSTTNLKRCFECKNVDRPEDCDQVVECGGDRQCYVHRGPSHVTFEYRYDMGCMPTRQCQTAATAYQNAGCMVCCNSTYCNFNACDQFKPTTTSTRQPSTTSAGLVPPAAITTTTRQAPTTSAGLVPHIHLVPGPIITAQYSSAATMRCSEESGYSISWRFNNGALPAGAHAYSGGSLVISSVNETNAGIYTCVASSTNRQASKDVNVTIQKMPAVVISVTKQPSGHPVAGQTFSLHCNVIGYPLPTITWSHTDTHGHPTIPSAVTISDNNRVLNIASYTPAVHNGNWECSATNGFGTSLSSAHVP